MVVPKRVFADAEESKRFLDWIRRHVPLSGDCLIKKLGTPMNLDQIEPNLLVGSCPQTDEDVERLRSDHGVTAVLNVQTDEDMEAWGIDWDDLRRAYEMAGIAVAREPVRDFDAEALRQRLPACVQTLRTLCEQGHVVYVHCSAGINRSPTTVIAYLHRCLGWELDDSHEHVLACRGCDPYIQAIMSADWSKPTSE